VFCTNCETSARSNLRKRPYRRRTWTVQWYSPGGTSVHPSNTCFLGPTRVNNPNGISIRPATLAQLNVVSSGILGHVLSLKIAPWYGGSGPHLIRGSWTFPSPQPKRHVDRFSRFAGLTTVTNRPTDHATRSVTIGRIYVRSTAMWPKRILSRSPAPFGSGFTNAATVSPQRFCRVPEAVSV